MTRHKSSTLEVKRIKYGDYELIHEYNLIEGENITIKHTNPKDGKIINYIITPPFVIRDYTEKSKIFSHTEYTDDDYLLMFNDFIYDTTRTNRRA